MSLDDLELELPKTNPGRQYALAAQAFAPKMKALAQRVLSSEKGIRIISQDKSELLSLRQRFYQWRLRERRAPDYDKTLEQFTFVVHQLPDGQFALDIKVFDLSDLHIEDLA